MVQNVKLPLIIALVVAGVLACSAFIYFQIVRGMAPEKPLRPGRAATGRGTGATQA